VNETSHIPESTQLEDTSFANALSEEHPEDEPDGPFDLRHVFNRVLNNVAANTACWYEEPEMDDDSDQEDSDSDENDEFHDSGHASSSRECCCTILASDSL
jgi:hypothetical protein